MTKHDLVEFVRSLVGYRWLPRQHLPICIIEEQAYLVVKSAETAADEVKERTYPLGLSRADLMEWAEHHGLDVSRTPESGVSLVATDPPFVRALRAVEVDGRRLFDDFDESTLCEVRMYPLRWLPVAMAGVA